MAARSSTVAGAVLVSPATGWDRTALGGARSKLVRLPDPVLALIIALSSYQLDRGQLDTTLRRIATGETSPLLEGDDREAARGASSASCRSGSPCRHQPAATACASGSGR